LLFQFLPPLNETSARRRMKINSGYLTGEKDCVLFCVILVGRDSTLTKILGIANPKLN